jgi:flavin reductase
MSKKLLVLSDNDNNDISLIGQEFIRGVGLTENIIDKINVNDQNVNKCLNCCKCKYNNGMCVQNDDMYNIYNKALLSEIIVIDCQYSNSIYNQKIKHIFERMFAIENMMKNKTLYVLISNCGMGINSYGNIIDNYVKKYISYLRSDNNRLGGYLLDNNNDSCITRQAFEMGIAV